MSQGVKAGGKRRHGWGTVQGRRVTSVNTRNVPVDVRAQFKAYCARHGYTMEAAMIELMKKAAWEDTTLPGARAPKKEETCRNRDTGSITGHASPHGG